MDVRWNKHVVILYDGKRDSEAVSALKTYIEKEFAPSDVIDADSSAFTPFISAKTRELTYRFCLRHAKWFLRWKSINEERVHKKRIREDKKADKNKDASWIIKNNPMVTRIINIINRFEPMIIICTTPESLKLTLYARKILEKDFKIFAAVIDFALDTSFVRLDADGFFVENEVCASALEKFGVEREKIVVSGIPVIEDKNILDKEEIRKKYGFSDNLPIVVINGGDYETDTIREDIFRLMETREKYNMLIICGNNKIRRRFTSSPYFSAGVGFGEKFEEEMTVIADVLITVPDSRVIFSAFKNGAAIVIAPHITVKERDIRKYLVKKALALPVKSPSETVAAVDELLVEPERRREFLMRGAKYFAASAAFGKTKKSALEEGISGKLIQNTNTVEGEI
jgi:UDP-N-acetylglucosamine:LPS N-acetylglucosamine transferase